MAQARIATPILELLQLHVEMDTVLRR